MKRSLLSTVTDRARRTVYSLVTRYYEWKIGVETTRSVSMADVGIVDKEAQASTPLGYAAFFETMRTLPLDYSSSVFVDYGVEKGRALCAAATLPFRKVIGLDISDVLVEMARRNVARIKTRRAQSVELVAQDARLFVLPPEANVLYFYNPFFGETLRTVVENIRRAHEADPRTIYVLFFNNDHFDTMVTGQPWIRKMRQTAFYPGISCGVYEIPSRPG